MERVESVNRRVPDEPQEDRFLADLSRLAKEHNVRVQDFRRGATTELGTHSTVEIDLTATAAYGDLCGLIDAVGRLSRIVDLTRLEVGQGASGEDNYTVRMNYALYYAMAPTQPGPANAQ